MSSKSKIAVTGPLAAILAATIAEVTPVAEATTPKTPKAKGTKKTPQARVFINGTIAMLDDTSESVVAFVGGFLKLPIRSRSGYDNFWSKVDGFVNAVKFRTLTVQGVGKMMAVLNYQAMRIIAAGGDDATTMQSIIDSIDASRDELLAAATHEHEQTALNITFGEMVEALKGDTNAAREKLAAYAADKGLTLPTDPTPATVADAVIAADDEIEGDADADETADVDADAAEVNA